MNAEQLHLLLYPTTQIEDDSLEKSDEIVRIHLKLIAHTAKRNKSYTARPHGTLLSVPKINSVSQNSVS